LIRNVNRVDCSTGRSEGCAPRAIRFASRLALVDSAASGWIFRVSTDELPFALTETIGEHEQILALISKRAAIFVNL
jgi:hypothetical protein